MTAYTYDPATQRYQITPEYAEALRAEAPSYEAAIADGFAAMQQAFAENDLRQKAEAGGGSSCKLGGVKHDTGKPRMSLIPRAALEAEARVMGFGERKYSSQNWRAGFAVSRLLDAALRHIVAYADGETLDPESGLSHLAHARCCLAFAIEQEVYGTGTDDRYKRSARSDDQ